VSYSIDQGALRAANLILAKTAYRLGEGISGILEMNHSVPGWATTLKVSVHLETFETLPNFLIDHNRRNNGHYNLRTVSEFTLSDCRRSSRIAFTLDVPSDDTPGFELCDSSRTDAPKGLEWQIRVLMLVGIPSESGTGKRFRQRSLISDSVPSEWDYTYTAVEAFAPLTRQTALKNQPSYPVKGGGTWLSYFIPSGIGSNGTKSSNDIPGTIKRSVSPAKGHTQEVDEGEQQCLGHEKNWKGKGREGVVEPDGLGAENEWQVMPLETLECVIPIKVWPGNTAFRPNEIEFRL